MKKLLALCMCAILLFTCSGCSLFWPGAFSEETSSSPDFDSTAYTSGWCYQRLNSRLQECYAALYRAVVESFGTDEQVTVKDSKTGKTQTSNGVSVSLPRSLFSLEEAETLYIAFTWDNPQFFYVGNIYGLAGHRENDKEYYTSLNLMYTMNAQERAAAQKRLDAAVEEMMADIRPGSYQFARELTLHDALIERCRYDDEAAESEDPAALFPHAFTAYGALVEGKAVCEGYSRAMQLLLHEAGIESTLVSGVSKKNGVAHMWNIVTIDGRNYHLDATWDDNDGRLRHNYFNLTTAEIEITHRIDENNIGVDTCTATDANYFRHNNLYLDTYSRDEIAEVVARHIRQGKTQIELRFPHEKFDNAFLFFSSSKKLLYEKVNALLKDDGIELWEYTLLSERDEGILALYKKP